MATTLRLADTANERACSFTISDCRVMSQYHSFFIILGGAGATRSAGLTIVANVANLTVFVTLYIRFFSLRSQYFAKFATSSKRRFSIERRLCSEILV